MKNNRCQDMSVFPEATEAKMDYGMGMGMDIGMPSCCSGQTMMCPPIYECPQVKCCHRVINYEVPHIIPCHTKTINHHVYRHTYQPCYSYSEEDESSEIYEPRCCK